jgi:hypothetical protein
MGVLIGDRDEKLYSHTVFVAMARWQEGVRTRSAIAALGAQDYLATRAQRASKAGFERALAQVPDDAAAPGDERKPR